MKTIEQRAHRAFYAINRYKNEIDNTIHEWSCETVIVDLLTDIRHLCDINKHDFELFVRRSKTRYDTEIHDADIMNIILY